MIRGAEQVILSPYSLRTTAQQLCTFLKLFGGSMGPGKSIYGELATLTDPEISLPYQIRPETPWFGTGIVSRCLRQK